MTASWYNTVSTSFRAVGHVWASVADIVSLKLDRLNLKLLMFLGRSRMLGLLQQIKDRERAGGGWQDTVAIPGRDPSHLEP